MTIRVMIVDDSVVIRGGVSRIVSGQPDMRVVGNARNGRQALERVERLAPDVIILDIEMPEMDGLEVLRRLRAARSAARVLVFSSYTRRGARVTIDALALWADDYVLKPSAIEGDGLDVVSRRLVSKIRTLCAPRTEARPPAAGSAGTLPAQPEPLFRGRRVTCRAERPGPVGVIVVAASTGGPKALMALVDAFPASLSVPVLIVQHMPPMFTAHLAESLGRRARVATCEASDGQPVGAGTVYIAPGGRHMGLAGAPHGETVIRIHDDPPVNECRPSADVMFRDASTVYGPGVLAVVLTGMGRDGLAGCRSVVAAGGHVVVQDRHTSVVWGMPGYVATEGLAFAVLPLGEIGPQLVALAG